MRARTWGAPLGRSELVRAMLWEGDPEAAWREAVAGGCTDELWLQLAAGREREHPEDVLPVYRHVIERLVEEKNKTAYQQAAGVVRSLATVMAGLGRQDEFAAYLAPIRTAHRPKRNFMAALSAAGL